MTLFRAGQVPNPLPTTQTFDARTGLAAPTIETQRAAQQRTGISMQQALAEAENLAQRKAVAEGVDYGVAAHWLRGKSSQRILIELVCRVMKLEEQVNDHSGE